MTVIRTKSGGTDILAVLEAMNAANGGANGISVTPAKAMKVPEVLACVNVLAQSMSMLPLSIYKKTESNRAKINDSQIYKVLGQKPNDYQSPLEFMRQMTFNAALHGNGYARKTVLRGKLLALWPLQSEHVKPKQRADGSVVYEHKVRIDGKQQTNTYESDEIFHIRGPNCSKGWVADSPIALARDTIATMIAIERFSSKFFTGNAKAKGAFQLPAEGTLDDEAFERLKETLNADNDDKTLLLEQGLSFLKMDYSARESQLAEVADMMIHKLCRIWRVQPHLIQSLKNATFSNIEHQSREFVDHTLMPWIRLWESAIKIQLMDPYDDAIYPKFSVQALLRGDSKTRSEVYAKAVGGPYMTPNQARALEDMDPIEGGNELLRPLNFNSATDKSENKE